MKKIVFAAALGLGLLASNPGHAVLITGVNDDFTIDWFLGAGQSDNDGGPTSSIDLSATGTFDVAEFTGAYVKLNVTVENTTVLSGAVTEAGITSFGMGTNPDATSVTFSDDPDGAFVDAEIQTGQQTFPAGFKQIDVCVFTQGCNGGSQGGALAAGASDSFMLTIFGDFSGGSVILEPFPIKFQTTEDSFGFGGSVKVSEPGSLVLLAVGLLVLGLVGRRRPAMLRAA
ncbi:MAG: cistern family PEP-CTERM protein [Kiloniellaceae bacterium]